MMWKIEPGYWKYKLYTSHGINKAIKHTFKEHLMTFILNEKQRVLSIMFFFQGIHLRFTTIFKDNTISSRNVTRHEQTTYCIKISLVSKLGTVYYEKIDAKPKGQL